MRAFLFFLLLLLPAALWANPAAPVWAPPLKGISFGIFCTLETTGQTQAPGTRSGFIHTVDGLPAFQWPDQRRVPATLGIAFGVMAQSQPGTAAPDAEMRVYRPGNPTPDVWDTGFYDSDPSFAFFRFDTADELIPGLWVFEAWSGGTRLYRVEFTVVQAAEAPGIAEACGGLS
jgi:hypothetical protein